MGGEGGAHPAEVAAAHGGALGGGGIVRAAEVVAAVGDVEDDFLLEGGGAEALAGAEGDIEVNVEFAEEAGGFAGEGVVGLGDDVGGAFVAEDVGIDALGEGVVKEVDGEGAPGVLGAGPALGGGGAGAGGGEEAGAAEGWGEAAVELEAQRATPRRVRRTPRRMVAQRGSPRTRAAVRTPMRGMR